MTSRRASFASAFTLLELILVLVLIAVVIGIAVPSLSGFANSQSVTNESSQIVALAHWARAQAITRGVCIRMNFDPAKRQYWLTVQNGPSYENNLQDTSDSTLGLAGNNNATTTSFGDVGEEMGRRFQAPVTVNFDCNIAPQSDGAICIEFRPTGRCDPGTITFRDSTGHSKVVGCVTGTESFHVLSDEEQLLAKNLLVPPPQVR